MISGNFNLEISIHFSWSFVSVHPLFAFSIFQNCSVQHLLNVAA